jgi:hypothetical protein
MWGRGRGGGGVDCIPQNVTCTMYTLYTVYNK